MRRRRACVATHARAHDGRVGVGSVGSVLRGVRSWWSASPASSLLPSGSGGAPAPALRGKRCHREERWARPSAPRRASARRGARSLARLGLRLGRPVFRGRPEWEVWELSGRGEAGTGVTTALEGVPVPGDSLVWMLAVVWILPAALHPKRKVLCTAVSVVGGAIVAIVAAPSRPWLCG